MVGYFVKAVNSRGEVIEEVITAGSEQEVLSYLKKNSLSPVIIEEKTEKKKQGFSFRKTISKKEILNFTSQLASLLSAGLPLAKALETLKNQATNPLLEKVISEIHQGVSQGKPLSETLAQYPSYFSKLYINMVKAGEVGGMLEKALSQVAESLERDAELKSRIKGALTYPAIMMVVMIISVTILLTFVVPKFTGMFQEMGRALPLPTQILLNISSFLKHWWWAGLGGIVIIGGALWYYSKTETGSYIIDEIKLKIPLVGKIVQEVILSRITLTLGSLLQSGVNILQAIEVTSEVSGNKKFSQALKKTLQDVKEGIPLSQSLSAHSEIFPSFVLGMIATGEEGGTLPEMLVKVGEYYDKETKTKVKTLTTLLEPLVILIMGVLVGFIIIAMLLPVFEMTSMIR